MFSFLAECWGDLGMNSFYESHGTTDLCVTGDYVSYSKNNMKQCQVHAGQADSIFVYNVTKYHSKDNSTFCFFFNNFPNGNSLFSTLFACFLA